MAGDTDQRADERYGSILRLTTLSPVRPDRLAALRRRLAFVAWAPGVGRPLLELATIHYARWIVFGSLPHPDGSDRRWLLNWKYLLFAATYDGPGDVYLNTFTDILPLRIAALFGDCFGFEARVEDAPGADGRVFAAYAFRDFVERNALSDTDSYAAVGATVRTIRQALAIKRTAQRGDRLTGAALERVQSEVSSMALGPPPTEPGFRDAVVGQWGRLARPARVVSPLTVVAPLDHEWDTGSRVFSRLPDTVFARLVVLPKTMQDDLGQQHPDRLPKDYLVFMSDYYGRLADYIEVLRAQPVAESIFGRCAGFPGTKGRQSFREWILTHSLKTQYYLAGYPATPVDELKRLLAVRAEIARWSLGESETVGELRI